MKLLTTRQLMLASLEIERAVWKLLIERRFRVERGGEIIEPRPNAPG